MIIKLTYICKLLNKNLLHNIFVSYLTGHKKFTTSNMFKHTRIGYPTSRLT
jgi:hypothetical protein